MEQYLQTLQPVHYLPILTTVFSAFFLYRIASRYLQKGGTHLFWWAVGVFTFLESWNDLFTPLIFINSIELQTLPVALALYRGEFFTQTNLLMAGATITILPVILLFMASQKYFIQGITMSGLKG